VLEQTGTFIKECDSHPEISDAEKKIFKNLQGCLYKQFQENLGDFQIEQFEIKQIKEEKTVRNAEIIMERKLDAGERDKVLHNPNVIYYINSRWCKKFSMLN
jgi:hypothetical protein